MKLWIDDVRPAPEGYVWYKSVNEAITQIEHIENEQLDFQNKAFSALAHYDKQRYFSLMEMCCRRSIDIIDIDHDAGDYVSDGGDYIKLLDWLEETGRNYPIHIHSMNPVGVENMRRIIQRNGWKEV